MAEYTLRMQKVSNSYVLSAWPTSVGNTRKRSYETWDDVERDFTRVLKMEPNELAWLKKELDNGTLGNALFKSRDPVVRPEIVEAFGMTEP